MHRLAVLLPLPLLLLAGCPDGSTSPPDRATDPAADRAAQVDLETRLAEGGDAVQAEAPGAEGADGPDGAGGADGAEGADAAKRLPELRYYAFDG